MGVSTASRVLLKPASAGTGVIAGTVPRSIAELAGITNLLSKELGSRNQINVAYAVFDGFKNLRTVKQIRALRGTPAQTAAAAAAQPVQSAPAAAATPAAAPAPAAPAPTEGAPQ